MITAVDTNVLLDILTADPEFRLDSERAILHAANQGEIVVSEPAFAELAVTFADAHALAAFLRSASIELRASSPAALHLAGRRWGDYARTRERRLTCPSCGRPATTTCLHCGTEITARQHLLADFLIGAHAVVHADRLLSRDRGYYTRHFPELLVE